MLKQKICDHIQRSLDDKQFNEELIFDIPDLTVKKVKDKLHLDLTGYKCVICGNDIRHVKKGHPDDIQYICEIPHIIKRFDRVEKSITQDRRTRQNLVSFEFYKKYGENTVKLVKLRIFNDKKLQLKTIYMKDE